MGEAKRGATKAATQNDREKILHLHREWWESNHGLDIERMARVFAQGDHYLMFNLQGHPYYGIAEKKKLWEFYQREVEIDLPITRVVRLEIDVNMAWLAAEVIFKVHEIGEKGVAAKSAGYVPTKTRVRSTEIYQRDDGLGDPQWRMWHFHCSPLPSADEPRPAFGDTARSRGELVP
jgi:hypothetical protein